MENFIDMPRQFYTRPKGDAAARLHDSRAYLTLHRAPRQSLIVISRHRSLSDQTQPLTMDSAAIEQMNKVRASLGMAPLPVPGAGPSFKPGEGAESSSESDDMATLDKRQAAAGSNWQKLEAERREKADREKRKAASKKQRDAAQRFAKLHGKGLGDVDDGQEEMDTRTWLLQQKKRQRKIEKARKLEEEMAAREQQAEYTTRDLAGVKVGHEVDEFDETAGEQVLTLKDADIGAESEDDELENADLRAKAQREANLNLKKKRPNYDPTEEGEEKGLLSKYDEEINGKKQKKFTLDGHGNTVDTSAKPDANGNVKSRSVKISLDMLKDEVPVSDYLDPSTIRVKKPSKKKKKRVRHEDVNEEAVTEDANRMEVDHRQAAGVSGSNSSSRKRVFDLDDDDDLQAKLAEQRRQALKKRNKMDGSELARQMREEMAVDESKPEEGGMTIDETSEFVANLKRPEISDMEERDSRTAHPSQGETLEREEDDDGDTRMDDESHARLETARERGQHELPKSGADVTATGLDDEDTMSGQGLGASVALLRKRGLVGREINEKDAANERRRAKFLAEKERLIADFDRRAREQREGDRRKGTFDKMSHRERETYAKQQNEARERHLSQLLDDEFKRNYRPTVELKYTDEFGRSMNPKEAFKDMSHMFHGKGSGKQKTEKRLKKIEDEKKEMSKGVLNVSEKGGMVNVQGREGKKQRQAGVRLQ